MLLHKTIDTMKVSRDSNSLTQLQINALVAQYDNQGMTHGTVDFFLNGTYHNDTWRENWINAFRALEKIDGVTPLNIWWRAPITFDHLTSNLSSNAASGQKVVIVADASKFSPGQSVVIWNNTLVKETNTVDTVDSGTQLTMLNNLANTYTTALAAKVTRPVTPAILKALLLEFPERRHDLFENGDIFDMLPEQSPFMGNGITDEFIFGINDVNTLVNAWNPWVRDVKTSLDAVFASHGKSGVITGITSITDFTAINYVQRATYQHFGYATIDHYPGDLSSTPQEVAAAVVADLTALYNKAGVPIVVGEFGYARQGNASQSQQKAVAEAVFDAVSQLPFVIGYNWWCGHGGAGFGDYCNLFEWNGSAWVARSALTAIRDAYKGVNVRKGVSSTDPNSGGWVNGPRIR